jgi:Putative Flp pilus-assembly TadE/G-like
MLTRTRARGAGGSRDERGAVAVLSGIAAVVLLLVGALVIDIGSVWMRRGQLQYQADRAALLAAKSALPATDDASRLKAAKYVGYYIACHVLPGQKQLDPQIPSCPGGTGPQSSTIAPYAQHLLDTGAVSFPKATQVKVIAPQARIDYGFGRVAGLDGSTQSKMAIATVASPGEVVPAALSVPCLLSAAGNVPNAGNAVSRILPVNYITAGALNPATTAPTAWPASYATAPSDAPVLANIATTPDPVISGSPAASFTLTGSNWGSALANVEVWFHKGPDTGTPVQAASLNLPVVDLLTGTGTVTGVLPSAVMDNPGTWEVRISKQAAPLEPRLWSNSLTLDVTMPAGGTEAIGCGRLLDSPRTGATTTTEALQQNFQLGIDHPIVQHPNLLSITAPSVTADDAVSLANDPNNAFSCTSTLPHVLDVPSPSGTPNCVRLQGNDAWVGTTFTEGVLGAESGGAAGRLVCSSSRPCAGPTATVRGVQINDDTFDQFIDDPTLLNNTLFYGLSSYVTNGLPILTPQTGLNPDIYKSHRFMWVPVMSSPLTPTSGGDYPVLTFRPIFVTQDVPSGWAPYDMLWDELNTLMSSLGLLQGNVQHGLMMSDDGQDLLGMRFMTIEPASLPLVPETYEGPTTEYVGVGPKLVKLVK